MTAVAREHIRGRIEKNSRARVKIARALPPCLSIEGPLHLDRNLLRSAGLRLEERESRHLDAT